MLAGYVGKIPALIAFRYSASVRDAADLLYDATAQDGRPLEGVRHVRLAVTTDRSAG
jgi:hypothetical protein